MTPLEAVLIILAGIWAGTINTIVGSGSLVTFPTLLFLGIPPVTANVSNSIGMLGGGLTGSWGYRRELAGTWKRLLTRLVPWSFAGAVIGALLLLMLPEEAFSVIVPVLILLGIALVIFGPRLNRWARGRHSDDQAHEPMWHRVALAGGLTLAGIYGGYFGAAQGVILMGLLSVLSSEPLQRLNGWKNILALTANLVSSVVFLIVAPQHIMWDVVLYLVIGTLIGGFIGAGVGRRLPDPILRAVIVVVGLLGIARLVFG
ncbi:sulfite exporter TauE/SafE family protein [Kribbia dieselivorans]|uniref:sulfite exporter TauE/SafE family protein n=1 Tax=Kribbia dieselivorans TaxID=331526 RepID=UPI0008387A68|nr:sulfite exporter TauE/SafE family protein [Kribbia dieselivorans]